MRPRAAGLGGRDLALVSLVCLAWAGNFLTSKLALLEFPPLLFTALRLCLLVLLLSAFIKRPPPGQWLRLAAVALCNGVLHFGLSFWSLSLSHTLASPAIVMQSYVPMARNIADTSIKSRAAGLFSTVGSKPSTSTPAKLSAIAAPVRQWNRSPSSHHASSAAIGT